MRRATLLTIGMLVAAFISTVAAAGTPLEIRNRDGSKWRGETEQQIEMVFMGQGVPITIVGEIIRVGELYLVVDGEVAGRPVKRTVFKSDIVSVRSLDDSGDDRPAARTRSRGADAPDAGRSSKTRKPDAGSENGVGVLFLPLEGGVGMEFRHEEIDELGEHADELGPGQLIVLKISSDGGLVIESEEIEKSIFKLRENHRVVAWIHKALSAGCSAAMCCEEIYFMTEGVAGSVTTISGGSAIQGPEQDLFVQNFVNLANRCGYSEHIARAMKASRFMCTYDKDPDTGEVTFYGDMSGEFSLSDEKSNLCFNASNAVHCGFADGIADNEDELAKLLQIGEWREIDDFGRDIAESWQKTVKRGDKEIPRLLQRRGYAGSAGDARERIGKLIQIDLKLLSWCRRAPLYCGAKYGLSADLLEREIEELRKQLADMR